jgi:hypothetical protein
VVEDGPGGSTKTEDDCDPSAGEGGSGLGADSQTTSVCGTDAVPRAGSDRCTKSAMISVRARDRPGAKSVLAVVSPKTAIGIPT